LRGDVERYGMPADPQNGTAQGSHLPGKVVEDILSSERRRVMLSCLADCDGKMVVDDLAAAVCAAEGRPVDEATRREAREDIYDRHLPKLTATGVVEYDSMREAIELLDEGLADPEEK